MNRFVAMGGVLLALAVMVALADAQQQGRGRGFGGFRQSNLGILASVEAVQTEIGATDEQKTEIAKIAEKLRGDRPAGAARGRGNLSEEEINKLREQAMQRDKEAREALAKALKPDQLKRLEQISLQLQGSAALTNPEVVAKLKLSDEQVAKLETIANEGREQMRALFQGGNAQDAREKFAEIRKSTDEKSVAVLNADQQKQFSEMKGKPFERTGLGFGRRGRGTRQGNNN